MMMRNVEVVLCYIDLLIHKYFIVDFNMRADDIHLRPFAYNFDLFVIFLTLAV